MTTYVKALAKRLGLKTVDAKRSLRIAVNTVVAGDRIETSNGMRRVVSTFVDMRGIGVSVEGLLSAMPDTIIFPADAMVVVENAPRMIAKRGG